MNRTFRLITALAAGLAASSLASAQAPAAQQARPAAVAPQATEAKIALINFEQVVLASNEGQVVTANTQKKFAPQKSEIEALGAEVENLKKNLPTNLSDEERANRLRDIDTKEKKLNRDVEDATNQYNTEWQEALAKVAQKIAVTMKNYAQQNGFTILLDVSSQQSNVLWALPSMDISQAVVDAYNKQSGIAPPPPPAPSAPRPSTPAHSTARPKPSGR